MTLTFEGFSPDLRPSTRCLQSLPLENLTPAKDEAVDVASDVMTPDPRPVTSSVHPSFLLDEDAGRGMVRGKFEL